MEPFLGQIRLVPYTFAPKGWAFCDGQLLPIMQHTALFSLLGTTYGGDGRQTFALPDLRGRVPVHSGGSHPRDLTYYHLGQTGGREQITLEPKHIGAMNRAVPGGQDMVDPNCLTYNDRQRHEALDLRQPYVALNYIIALQGIYPSRD